jgi:transcriptional regulator with GAF, ATPase, and Fis domain
VTVEPDPQLEGLTETLSESGPSGEFIGDSPVLRQVLEKLRDVADTDATVLILGETGTGKGLAARTLHAWSARAGAPFIQVSCGALPEGLVESELFGHERGAFTGALRRKLGKVELADDGTLFLDEIGDMPLATQVKLLRLLEEGTYERVGGTETLTARMRVVAATNRDLETMVRQGTFRQDLFYRLQVVPVRLPTLRERADDIPLLATHFMESMAAHLGRAVRRIAPEALAQLRAHDWPGNVRELQHVIQRAVIGGRGEVLEGGDILLQPGHSEPPKVAAPLTPEEYERQYLRDALEQTHWVVKGPTGAAVLLGMPESTLRLRMKRLGLRRP